MEEEYEKIREQALTEPEKAEAEPEAVEPEAHDREGRPMPEPKPKAEPKAEPKKKRGRPKKGEELSGRWTCPDCGGNFSVRTKKHACSKPRGLEAEEEAQGLQEAPAVPLTREPPPAPPEPLVTFDMCRKFLYGEIKARRDARRERISMSMY